MKKIKKEAIEKRKSKIQNRLKLEVDTLLLDTEKTCIAFEKELSVRMGRTPAAKSKASPPPVLTPSEH